MTYRFNGLEKPEYRLTIKERGYNFAVNHLMRYGRKHVVKYFRKGVTLFVESKYNGCDGLMVAEVGTSEGINARVMLQCLPIKKLYCIDPYLDYNEERTSGIVIKKQTDSRVKAENIARKSKGRMELIIKNSKEASKIFKDNFFDLVYIDANHSYDFVKEDIALWYPKVKKNCILGGHDFGSQCMGVVKAVLEFCNNNKLKFNGGRDGDWWVVKKLN